MESLTPFSLGFRGCQGLGEALHPRFGAVGQAANGAV